MKKRTAWESYALKLEKALEAAQGQEVDLAVILRRTLNSFVDLQMIIQTKEQPMTTALAEGCAERHRDIVEYVDRGLKNFHDKHKLDIVPTVALETLPGGGPHDVDLDHPPKAIQSLDMDKLCEANDRRHGKGRRPPPPLQGAIYYIRQTISPKKIREPRA